jgi:hypothetical protein
MNPEALKTASSVLPQAASIPYPGDEVMAELLGKVGVDRTMLELRAITLGFLAGFRNKRNTPDLFYTLIRGGRDIPDRDPDILTRYTRALVGLKNKVAAWDATTEMEELKPAPGADPVAYIDQRLAEGELFAGLMLDGNEENILFYQEKTQQSYPALLQVMAQLHAIKEALQSGEMPNCPDVLELLESYGRELWSIMIYLKRSEANEIIERKSPAIGPLL